MTASGQTGQGSLPDSTLRGSSGPGEPSGTWTDPNQDPGSVPATMGPPAEFVTGGLWGLSGSLNPDKTPRTHAAPFADPTLPVGEYYLEADAAHAYTRGGPEERRNIPSVATFRLDHVTADGGSGGPLQPLSGQIRSQAGYDAVQGYGGGADGPGGVNATMPLHTEQRLYPGNGYSADNHVNASEVPFLVPGADQFIAQAPELGPWMGGMYDGPTASVRTQDIITGDTPAQGGPVGQGLPAYATSFWR